MKRTTNQIKKEKPKTNAKVLKNKEVIKILADYIDMLQQLKNEVLECMK